MTDFGNSNVQVFTIPNGADGSAVESINYGVVYGFVSISCDDITGVSGKTLEIWVSETRDGVLKPFYDTNANKFVFIPSEAFFIVLPIIGVAQIQVRVIGGTASADTDFNIRALDSGNSDD